jgi:hypothetical protein
MSVCGRWFRPVSGCRIRLLPNCGIKATTGLEFGDGDKSAALQERIDAR